MNHQQLQILFNWGEKEKNVEDEGDEIAGDGAC